MYYLAKVEMKEEGANKSSKLQVLVEDTGITEAEAVVSQYMRDTMADWKITSISQTKIEDVIKK